MAGNQPGALLPAFSRGSHLPLTGRVLPWSLPLSSWSIKVSRRSARCVPERPASPCGHRRAMGSGESGDSLPGGRVQHLDSGSGRRWPSARSSQVHSPGLVEWGRLWAVEKQDLARKVPWAPHGTRFPELKCPFRAHTGARGRPVPRGHAQPNRHWRRGKTKRPLSAQRVDARPVSSPFSPARIPELRAAGEASNPLLWRCGGKERFEWRREYPGKAGRQAGRREEAPGRGAGRPSPLASAPSIPH